MSWLFETLQPLVDAQLEVNRAVFAANEGYFNKRTQATHSPEYLRTCIEHAQKSLEQAWLCIPRRKETQSARTQRRHRRNLPVP